MRHRDLLRQLDPMDPATRPPDGESLLRSIISSPYERRRTRGAGPRTLALVPLALVAALGAAVFVVATGDDERAASTEAGPTIVHYTIREHVARSGADGDMQEMATTEAWQLSDGSRQRTLSRVPDRYTAPDARGVGETVLTRSESLTFVPGRDEIIRYRADDDYSVPGDPGAEFDRPGFAPQPLGAIGSPEAVGDPRTLPERADRGEDGVRARGAATVRGEPVRQFEVGDCREPTRTRRIGPNATVTSGPDRAVVSLGRDSGLPVRIEISPCDPDAAPEFGGRTLDYLSFEVLPATPEHRELLELAPHPGVPVVDGIEIDRAEEREAG